MGLIITLKVVPSSGRQQCIIDKNGTLKCYLKNPPERGKANDELIKMIAKALGIPQAGVEIISGEASRTKKININYAVTVEKLLAALGIEKQMNIDLL